MKGMSEDEGDFDDEPDIKVDEEKNEAARKAREERAERLRKMMEDDGKFDESVSATAVNSPQTKKCQMLPLQQSPSPMRPSPPKPPTRQTRHNPLQQPLQVPPCRTVDGAAADESQSRKKSRTRMATWVSDEHRAVVYAAQRLTMMQKKSHQGGNGLGILLGRGAGAKEAETGGTKQGKTNGRQESGEHCEFLQESVRMLLLLLLFFFGEWWFFFNLGREIKQYRLSLFWEKKIDA